MHHRRMVILRLVDYRGVVTPVAVVVAVEAAARAHPTHPRATVVARVQGAPPTTPPHLEVGNLAVSDLDRGMERRWLVVVVDVRLSAVHHM
jgi:hypothetical protein